MPVFQEWGILSPVVGGIGREGGRAVLACGWEPVSHVSCQKGVTAGQAGDKAIRSAVEDFAAETLWPRALPCTQGVS